jgi:8-oxo-dGTP diphosphatase
MSAAKRHHTPVRISVDLVVLTVRDDRFQVLLVERGNEPYQGRLALPGGFMRGGETLDTAAQRELAEETALGVDQAHIEQLHAYSAPDRDPRGRVITVSYLAIAPSLPVPVAGTDARAASWVPVEMVSSGLAFDHDEILADGLERARSKLENTTLATAFCPGTFTIGELRRVYEVVWGLSLDPRNFSRKVMSTDGFVLPTDKTRSLDTGRPAVLYQAGQATTLYPPILRERLNGSRQQ